MKSIFLTIFLLCFQMVSFGSSIDNKTVTFKQFFDELVKGKSEKDLFSPFPNDYLVTIKNVTVKFDRTSDNDLDLRYLHGGEPVHVHHNVSLYNCVFDVEYWLLFRNVIFDGYVSVWNCTNIKLKLKDCIFKNTFRVYNNNVDFIHFQACQFLHGFKMQRSSVLDYLTFSDCLFSLTSSRIGKDTRLDMDDKLFVLQNKAEPIDVTIERCSFRIDSSLLKTGKYLVNLSESNFNNLRFYNDILSVPLSLVQSAVANQFTAYGCYFHSHIFNEAFNFNSANAKVQWSSLAGKKIAIKEPGGGIITGHSVTELKDEFIYSTLIACYASYYDGYRAQGNRLAANACYIEWKDIETIYLDHLQEKNHSFNNYFNWLMNVFLKTFCDYGTNPIKSVKWSLFVMLFFAGIYFFFPYENGLHKEQGITKKFLLFIQHYTSGKTFKDIHAEMEVPADISEEARHYQRLYKQHERILPFYFRFNDVSSLEKLNMGHRLELAYLSFLDVMFRLLKKNHLLNRMLRAFVYFFIFISTALYLLLIRILNSFTLSLNSFSTLGFGEIPVTGLARYLTVLEGFIGWFLLSIFSVALISQIIQ